MNKIWPCALSILRVRIAEYQPERASVRSLRPEPGANAPRLILISNLDKALASFNYRKISRSQQVYDSPLHPDPMANSRLHIGKALMNAANRAGVRIRKGFKGG